MKLVLQIVLGLALGYVAIVILTVLFYAFILGVASV